MLTTVLIRHGYHPKESTLNVLREYADYIGVKYAASVCNGTMALHLALMALGIGEGDEVIVPTFTYIASVNTIIYCGATPVFADSEKDYWQLDPAGLEELITPRTKAIMPVHLYGHACDVNQFVILLENISYLFLRIVRKPLVQLSMGKESVLLVIYQLLAFLEIKVSLLAKAGWY